MKIKELQEKIADALNSVEDLVQGGCIAFAEDSREVYERAAQQLQQGKIVLVVVTPDLTRNGSSIDGLAIPAETRLLVQCSEKPALARARPASLTALDAAETVARALEQP